MKSDWVSLATVAVVFGLLGSAAYGVIEDYMKVPELQHRFRNVAGTINEQALDVSGRESCLSSCLFLCNHNIYGQYYDIP